jgi:hypothetical protein
MAYTMPLIKPLVYDQVGKHPSGFKSEEEDDQQRWPPVFHRPREDHVAGSLELEVLNRLLCAGQLLKLSKKFFNWSSMQDIGSFPFAPRNLPFLESPSQESSRSPEILCLT